MPHRGSCILLCLLALALAAWAGVDAADDAYRAPSAKLSHVKSIYGVPVSYYNTGWGLTWPRPIIEDFPLNTGLFRAVNGTRSDWADAFFTLLLPLGKAWALIPALLLAWRFRRELLAPLALSQVLGLVITRIPKEFFTQPRPGLLLWQDTKLLEGVWLGSFPSADTALVFALATLFARGRPWGVQVLWWGYAGLIGYERMYVGAHFPLDVLAGALVGVGSVYLARFILARWRRPTKMSPPPVASGPSVV
jgi:membrane-associated phospholipid phosphatase